MYIGNNIQHSQMSTLKRPTLWGPWPQKSAAHPQAATNATPPARLASCATFLVQVRPNCVCVCVCDLVIVATYTSYYVHTYTRVFYFRKLGSAQWANVASIQAETRAALIELEYVETVSILLQQDGLGHDLARLCCKQK